VRGGTANEGALLVKRGEFGEERKRLLYGRRWIRKGEDEKGGWSPEGRSTAH